MKTTIDLPDEVVRELKITALRNGQKLGATTMQCLTLALAASPPGAKARKRRRVKLPLIECRRPAVAGEELTPERVADLLLRQEWPMPDEASRH